MVTCQTVDSEKVLITFSSQNANLGVVKSILRGDRSNSVLSHILRVLRGSCIARALLPLSRVDAVAVDAAAAAAAANEC